MLSPIGKHKLRRALAGVLVRLAEGIGWLARKAAPPPPELQRGPPRPAILLGPKSGR
jgi:hypothetical protein